MIKDLVSIITPVYNNSKFIKQTIESVQGQTHQNWELLLVDDCSTDNSADIIMEFAGKDKRVKYYKLEKNSGAAAARNLALIKAKGNFIAYLDADDLWRPTKLYEQLKFMKAHDVAFSCTDYEKINECGESLKKIIKIPNIVDYDLFLRNTIIQTVGVVVDVKKVEKELLEMPNIRRRQDAATWCKLLKNGYNCYRVPNNLSCYRVVKKSLSSNKIKAIKGTWFLYRKIEKLPLLKAFRCFLGYAYNGVRKRIYTNFCITKKCLVIGKFAIKKNIVDGQTVKSKTIYDSLTERYGRANISKIDTYGWKKRPIRIFLLCIIGVIFHKDTIIMPASNGIKIFGRILYFAKYFIPGKRRIHYVVVGSWLYDLLQKNKRLIKVLKRFDNIFVETNLLKQNLELIGFHNVSIVYNYKKIKIITPTNIKTFRKKHILQLCIFSRVNREKGIEDAVLALSSINKNQIRIKLDIYGPINPNFSDRFKELLSNNKEYVAYKGVVNPSESTRYISRYDALLFPTKYYTEGIPGTIIDAFASGVPVVASRWQNYTDIIKEGKNGITFEFGIVEDLISKLSYIYNKQYILDDMSECCIESAKQYCSKSALNPIFKSLEVE
jgi:hypothetical protein